MSEFDWNAALQPEKLGLAPELRELIEAIHVVEWTDREGYGVVEARVVFKPAVDPDDLEVDPFGPIQRAISRRVSDGDAVYPYVRFLTREDYEFVSAPPSASDEE